jgi:hypothetical protein
MSLAEGLKKFSNDIDNKKYNFTIEKLEEPSSPSRDMYAIDGSQIELLNFGSMSVFAFRAGYRKYKNLEKTEEHLTSTDFELVEKDEATIHRRRVEMDVLKDMIQKVDKESLIVLDGNFETYERKGFEISDTLKKHNFIVGLSKRTSLFGMIIYYLQKMNHEPPYLAFINPSEIDLPQDYRFNVGFINFNGLCFRIDWPKDIDKKTLISLCSEMLCYTKEKECFGFFYPQFSIHTSVKFKKYEKEDLRMQAIKEMNSLGYDINDLLKYDDFYRAMGRI